MNFWFGGLGELHAVEDPHTTIAPSRNVNNSQRCLVSEGYCSSHQLLKVKETPYDY